VIGKIPNDPCVQDVDLAVGHFGELVDGRPPTEEVQDHLPGHLLGIGGDPLGHHPVVGGGHHHRPPTQLGLHPALDGG
jgi:hypothetical protein